MKVHKCVMPILVIVTLLGTVQLAKALGYWSTTSKGTIIADEAGQPDPAGIKGWMTLTAISESYNIPLEKLNEATGLPSDQEPETELKELEDIVPDFEIELVREAVRQHCEETGSHTSVEDKPGSP
jgi:hypothetical protein